IAGSLAAFMLVPAAPFARRGQEKAAQAPPRVIRVTARNFEFEPPEIRVRVGEWVQLRVSAEGQTQGLGSSPFPEGAQPNTPPGLSFASGDDCVKVGKGTTETVEFTAQKAGTYLFSCCQKCGWGHSHMKGKIIVEP